MQRSMAKKRRSRALEAIALTATALMVLAGCSTDGSAGGNEGGEQGGEVEGLYAFPEDFSDNIIFEAGSFPLGTWGSRHIDAMKDTIEDLSGGKMTVELSSGYAVHGAAEVTTSLRDGVVKLAALGPAYEPAGWDSFVWFTTAMSNSITSARPVLSDLAAVASTLEQSFEDPYLEAEYERQGVVPLLPRFQAHAAYHLLCTDEVTSLEQARGKLVRTAGPNWVAEAEAVGMTPVALAPADQFEGLQRGVIDCVMGPVRDWDQLDLFSVAHHLTVDDSAAFVGFPWAFGANPAWWEGLPPGAQNIVWTALFEYITEWTVSRIDGDVFGLQRIAGDDSYELLPMQDDLREALVSYQSEKVDEMLGSVPPGTDPAVLEAEIDQLTTDFESWMAFLEADEEIGGAYAATWSEFAESAPEIDAVTAPAWKERVWEEIFLPRMPNPEN